MNIMIFCSNPVNGGTARIFYETIIGLESIIKPDDKLFPCINRGNRVEVYKRIPNLIEIPIEAEEDRFSGFYGGSVFRRFFCAASRFLLYRKIKKNNIKIICSFIQLHEIDAVIIHNGGYVGDSLCNQVLEAAYKCASRTSHRIYVLHSDRSKSFFSKLRFRNYDLKVSREATEIVTVSEYTKQRIKQSSFIYKDIVVIHNGIEVKKTLPDIQLDKIPPQNPANHNVLMIGNFLDNKGQMQFIECANILYKKDKKYRFAIIGNIYDDSYFHRCMKMIDNQSLHNVISIYHGINNASDYIDRFDALTVPSMYDESFGLISVEAMANGVPVVAFACGGIPEVIKDGQDGFIVPIGDSSMMADKIDYLIKNTEERNRMAQMCQNDYKSKFSTRSMVEHYLKLLE